MDLIIKNGLEFTQDEQNQVKDSLYKEFKVQLPSEKQLSETTFFLLTKNNKIYSMGGLLKTEPVIFDNSEFCVYGFVNITANIKGKGYGKIVVLKMMEFLKVQDATGIGFCNPKNAKFYEKCGLVVNSTITSRFVYLNGSKRITNQDGQYFFYQESSDNFIQQVLIKSTKDVFIPAANLW